MTLFAKQATAFVPIFDITAEGEDVGTITNLPNEGVVWTLRVLDVTCTTYTATTVHGALEEARAAYLEILAGTHWLQAPEQEYDEDHIEDEDGEIARMRQLEYEAELYYEQEPF